MTTDNVRTGARARELVQRQLDMAKRITYQENRDRVGILLRSVGPGASGETIRQLLAARFGQHVEGLDAGLRASLLFVQLFGLSRLRDMVGLPQLAEASDAEILWYLAPAIHQILVPARAYLASRRPLRDFGDLRTRRFPSSAIDQRMIVLSTSIPRLSSSRACRR
jgi:hypothetical protein